MYLSLFRFQVLIKKHQCLLESFSTLTASSLCVFARPVKLEALF